MNNRLANHLIRRLIRYGQKEAMAAFERQGIVDLADIQDRNMAVAVTVRASRAKVAELVEAAELLASGARGRRPNSSRAAPTISPDLIAKLSEEIAVDDPMFDEALAIAVTHDDAFWRQVDEIEARGEEERRAASSAVDYSKAENAKLVRILRETVDPPRPDEVAALLLLAKAVAASGMSLEDLLVLLRGPRPVITLISPVDNALRRMTDLLARGLILLGEHEMIQASDLIYGASKWRAKLARKQVIAVNCRPSQSRSPASEHSSPQSMKDLIAAVMAARQPVLILADGPQAVPQRLADVSMLTLVTGPLDSSIIRETIGICLRAMPGEEIDDELCACLDLTDLMSAIRPGATPDGALEALRRYAIEDGSEEDDTDVDWGGRAGGRWSRLGKASKTASDAIVIEPDKSPSAPNIDTVSGYGGAIDWAKELRADLADWKAGRIPWSDLSTKILLAGPPGTGKTTFARTIGNSLSLPVFISSPANWLEPGYLGDVLKRMKKAFAEARSRAPAILFIDEIDGIGTRMSDGEDRFASYGRNLINQLLMLIDGTGDSEGVILIGATNRPDDLDPALVRAGRLETRVDIPLPDVAALAGIIAQHVGSALVNDSALAKTAGSDGMSGGSVGHRAVTAGHVRRNKVDLPLSGADSSTRPSTPDGIDGWESDGQTDPAPTKPAAAEREKLFERLARSAAGLSGADVERIVRTARQSARRERRDLNPSDLINAFGDRHRELTDDVRWRLAIHEAGHVVAHRALGFGEPLGAYIDQNGGKVITAKVTTGQTEGELAKKLILLMAGRAAEELALGQVSASAGGPAHSDLARATMLVCRMEAQYGFGSLLHFPDFEMVARLNSDKQFATSARNRLDKAYEAAVAALKPRLSEIETEAQKMMEAAG